MNTNHFFPALIALLTLALNPMVAPDIQAQSGANEESIVYLTQKTEPGTPFVLTVTVLNVADRTPVNNVRVFIYQTNSKGDYERNKAGVARISGTAYSDQNGKITFHTIYPRGYNDSPTGEHMHFRISAPGFQTANADLIFADYYRKRYNFDRPYTYKVYLKTLEKADGKMSGEAFIFMKKKSGGVPGAT